MKGIAVNCVAERFTILRSAELINSILQLQKRIWTRKLFEFEISASRITERTRSSYATELKSAALCIRSIIATEHDFVSIYRPKCPCFSAESFTPTREKRPFPYYRIYDIIFENVLNSE